MFLPDNFNRKTAWTKERTLEKQNQTDPTTQPTTTNPPQPIQWYWEITEEFKPKKTEEFHFEIAIKTLGLEI